MSNLQVKNMPDELFGELRRRAAQSGLTVRDYVLQLIEADQRLPTAGEWLEELRAQPPVVLTAADVVNAVAEGRTRRDDELPERLSTDATG